MKCAFTPSTGRPMRIVNNKWVLRNKMVLFSSFCSKEQLLYWSVNTFTILFWFFERQLAVLTCWTRRMWSNFSWSKYNVVLPFCLDFPLIEWWFSYATVLSKTRLLISPPFIGGRDQGPALLWCFCSCHHFTL